jgi:voltage-gated potassium channel
MNNEKKKESKGEVQELKGIRARFDNSAKALRESWTSIKGAKLPNIILVIFIIATLVGLLLGFWVERGSGMFPSDPDKQPFVRFVDGLYFSIVTMASVGYGDYSPKTTPGKLFDMLVIISGALCFATLTATLASIRIAKLIGEEKEKVELSKLTGHTVICGWKKTMDQNLEDMFRLNPTLKGSEIVVIANITQDTIDLFKNQYPEFKDINFVRSEDYTDSVLMSVNIKGARKAFILADESTDSSLTEKDSRTVMTAMTISTIAKNLHITAELLDPKFETYLEKAYVAEIIYPRQYGRLVLAHSALSTGFVQVMNSLLDLSGSANIKTKSFPLEFVGKPYSSLKSHFAGTGNVILIGLVENVGSYFERKQEVLRDAQKTANISKIVDNLQKVKMMKNNNPVFNPSDDYVIPDHSIAILVETAGNGATGGNNAN